MTNMEDITVVDELWAEYFVDPPARMIIPITFSGASNTNKSELLLLLSGPYKKEIINCKGVPEPISPGSTAVKAGQVVFCHGDLHRL